jgi:hypothetical protein
MEEKRTRFVLSKTCGSEWDPESLQEGRNDVAKNMKLFEEANALYRTR